MSRHSALQVCLPVLHAGGPLVGRQPPFANGLMLCKSIVNLNLFSQISPFGSFNAKRSFAPYLVIFPNLQN